MKKFIFVSVILFLTLPCYADEINLEFFNSFNDCYLPKYVDMAIKENHSIKEITAKVQEYRHEVQSSFGKELPILTMNASYLGFSVPKLDNFSLSQNSFILPFIFAYEPDLLLKNRDKTKSVKKEYEAVKAEEKSAKLSLLGEVSAAYINILQYDELIKIQENIIKNQSEQLEKIKLKYQYGIATLDEVRSSNQELVEDENTFKNLSAQRQTVLNDFAILIGLSSDRTNEIERGNLKNFEYTKTIPEDVQSDVIFKRPDIKEIEYKMEKAQIDTKIAKKEFFPSFGITGAWIFNTISHKNFFNWDNSIVSLMVGATQDLFRGGVKLANLRIKKDKYNALFEKYTQKGLVAVKEVNTSLCIINADTDVDKNLDNKMNLEKEKLSNSERKLKYGTISNLELLQEIEKSDRLQQTKIKAKAKRLIDYTTLYKACGGDL
ncbi:MAG: TolC family protein [Clostridiaceae bacterium]|jgi:outer membrane protein, multidrug efflux system|nr:TolC family protein [Clostridiaceae bacterium]